MQRFLTDANFNHRILRGLITRHPDLDILTAQSLGFERTGDPNLLDWAFRERRVIPNHDAHTMIGFAYERTARETSFPGLVEVGQNAPIGRAIEDILILIGCLDDDEWENQVWYVPL